MEISEKIKYFEYFVSIVFNKVNIQKGNDLSKLKLFKLHFLTSAILTDEKNDGLLEIFDKFYALPFGPVEGDIYDNLTKLNYFAITSECTSIITDFDPTGLDEEITTKINTQFEALITQNNTILDLVSTDLVEITHKWNAWKIAFRNARQEHKYSRLMSSDLIKVSNKVYSIN
jgi:uncharacterized phage-associated protein